MVVGDNIPRPRELSGIQGWTDKTTKPKTKRTVLKVSSETVYCFQFCGPLFSLASIQRKNTGAR